eukprot:scaffold98736_cov66-Phaeocystis_antarctica.AAC.2
MAIRGKVGDRGRVNDLDAVDPPARCAGHEIARDWVRQVDAGGPHVVGQVRPADWPGCRAQHTGRHAVVGGGVPAAVSVTPASAVEGAVDRAVAERTQSACLRAMPTAEHIGADAVQHAEGGEPLEEKSESEQIPRETAAAGVCGSVREGAAVAAAMRVVESQRRAAAQRCSVRVSAAMAGGGGGGLARVQLTWLGCGLAPGRR